MSRTSTFLKVAKSSTFDNTDLQIVLEMGKTYVPSYSCIKCPYCQLVLLRLGGRYSTEFQYQLLKY